MLSAHLLAAVSCMHNCTQVMGGSREDIVRIFQWWRFANRQLDAQVQELGERGPGGRCRW